MKARIHHAALNVVDFDWYRGFFETVFCMQANRFQGEAPHRQLWFPEGIQLNEVTEEGTLGDVCDHISLGVDDVPTEAAAEAIAHGCAPLPGKAHWFLLPNGVRVELKPY